MPAFLQRRQRQPELMDDPVLDAGLHRAALDGLARVNRVSGSLRVLWPAVRDLAQRQKAPLRLLDLATGGGDLPLGLWRRAQRAGLRLEIAGCDVSPRAVDYAREQAARQGAEIEFHVLDVLASPLPEGFDCVTCSLFLHHLSDQQAVELLTKMWVAARRMVLVNDLVRSAWGLGLVHVGMRLLTRSPVVHVDGPLSMRAAFTLDEVRGLAVRARLPDAVVSRRFPCRFLLTWRRP